MKFKSKPFKKVLCAGTLLSFDKEGELETTDKAQIAVLNKCSDVQPVKSASKKDDVQPKEQ